MDPAKCLHGCRCRCKGGGNTSRSRQRGQQSARQPPMQVTPSTDILHLHLRHARRGQKCKNSLPATKSRWWKQNGGHYRRSGRPGNGDALSCRHQAKIQDGRCQERRIAATPGASKPAGQRLQVRPPLAVRHSKCARQRPAAESLAIQICGQRLSVRRRRLGPANRPSARLFMSDMHTHCILCSQSSRQPELHSCRCRLLARHGAAAQPACPQHWVSCGIAAIASGKALTVLMTIQQGRRSARDCKCSHVLIQNIKHFACSLVLFVCRWDDGVAVYSALDGWHASAWQMWAQAKKQDDN